MLSLQRIFAIFFVGLIGFSLETQASKIDKPLLQMRNEFKAEFQYPIFCTDNVSLDQCRSAVKRWTIAPADIKAEIKTFLERFHTLFTRTEVRVLVDRTENLNFSYSDVKLNWAFSAKELRDYLRYFESELKKNEDDLAKETLKKETLNQARRLNQQLSAQIAKTFDIKTDAILQALGRNEDETPLARWNAYNKELTEIIGAIGAFSPEQLSEMKSRIRKIDIVEGGYTSFFPLGGTLSLELSEPKGRIIELLAKEVFHAPPLKDLIIKAEKEHAFKIEFHPEFHLSPEAAHALLEEIIATQELPNISLIQRQIVQTYELGTLSLVLSSKPAQEQKTPIEIYGTDVRLTIANLSDDLFYSDKKSLILAKYQIFAEKAKQAQAKEEAEKQAIEKQNQFEARITKMFTELSLKWGVPVTKEVSFRAAESCLEMLGAIKTNDLPKAMPKSIEKLVASDRDYALDMNGVIEVNCKTGNAWNILKFLQAQNYNF